MGAEYALLRFDRSIDIAPILAAAARRRVPMASIDVESDDASMYDRKLILSRPDQHIAWRGDSKNAELAFLYEHPQWFAGIFAELVDSGVFCFKSWTALRFDRHTLSDTGAGWPFRRSGSRSSLVAIQPAAGRMERFSKNVIRRM